MIELACGDHGNDKVKKMAKEIENGKCLVWTGLSDLRAIDDTSSGNRNHFTYSLKSMIILVKNALINKTFQSINLNLDTF